MTRHDYLDFDLLIESSGTGGYRARVLNSPVGETPATPVTIPFSDLEIENFLLKVGRPRRQGTRSVNSPEVAAVKEFGGQLFDAVFKDGVRVALGNSLAQVEAREDTGLRVRLRLADCPELADLPWEYLYYSDVRRFLALSEWTPVVRYLDLPGRIRPLLVRPPLRILVMAASPVDFEQLDAQAEFEKVVTALEGLQGAGRVQVDRVRGGSLADLRKALRQDEYHVFHFIGHGRYDASVGDGVLALEGPGGRALTVSGADLGALLHDHRSLRLALLNSCEGARGGLSDPYSGTAQSLVHQGIPAVVAMQFEITDEAAITFSHALYEAVADGYPLDAAMAEARNAVRDWPNPLEWATPVLYLRAADGRIFDVQAGTGTGAPTPRGDAGAATPPGAAAAGGPVPPATAPPPVAAPGPGTGQIAAVPPPRPVPQTASSRRAGVGASSGQSGGPPVFRTVSASPLPPEPSATDVPAATRGAVFPPVGPSVHAAVGPNDLVAAAGTDGVVRVLSTRAGRIVAQCTLPRRERPTSISWSPWPRHVVTAHDHGLLTVWDLETEVPVRILRFGSGRIDAIEFSHDGRYLAAAADRRIGVFDSAGVQVRDMVVPADAVLSGTGRALGRLTGLAFPPDDRSLLVAGDDGVVRQFDVTGRLVQSWRLPHAVQDIAVSDAVLVTGSAAGRMAFWGWDGGLRHRAEHDGSVEHVVASSAATFASAARDGTVRFWDESGAAVAECAVGSRVAGLGFLSDATGLLTVTQAGDVELWRSGGSGRR